MASLTLKPEITLGEIFTGFSIIVSVIIFIVTNWISSQKDRKLSRKEHADTIRHAAGAITAKLERWGNLGLRYFEDIQPVLVDADVMLTQKQDFIKTRDFLWRTLVDKHAISSQRIVDEQIEIAYSDLYGYDPRIQQLFTTVVDYLHGTDQIFLNQVVLVTQEDIFSFQKKNMPVTTTQLGNVLRTTCGDFAAQYKALMGNIVAPFRSDMIKLINATDIEIVDRKVQVSSPQEYHKVWEQLSLPSSPSFPNLTSPLPDRRREDPGAKPEGLPRLDPNSRLLDRRIDNLLKEGIEARCPRCNAPIQAPLSALDEHQMVYCASCRHSSLSKLWG